MENREGTSLMRHLVEDEGEDLLKFIELPKLVVLSGNSVRDDFVRWRSP